MFPVSIPKQVVGFVLAKTVLFPDRDCALMLGWVQRVLQSSILTLPTATLSPEKKLAAVNAINKVRMHSLAALIKNLLTQLNQIIWIQNDLFSRHYINE